MKTKMDAFETFGILDYGMFKIIENGKEKVLRSKNYNYHFNKKTGFMAQWGETQEQDPGRAPGPVIADIEVLNMCKGPGGKLCNFCYKSNTPKGHYMSFEEYKELFEKLPKTLTQIAFGADADLSLNPDIFKIMEYTREQGVIPNITVADINKETAKKLAKICGAVAVSYYPHAGKDLCLNSVKYLTEAGLDQVNIHFMLSKETYPLIDDLINDIKNDPRLKKLNAVVFLSLKQKGRGVHYNGCSQQEFQEVIEKCFNQQIPFGFDSCSAIKFINSLKNLNKQEKLSDEDLKLYIDMSEPCESFQQSIYINERGLIYPCSFMEKEAWDEKDGRPWNIFEDINDEIDFLKKVWFSPRSIDFAARTKMCHACGEGCSYYKI